MVESESSLTPQAAARAAGVCPRTIRKWAARYAAEGVAGLRDRSSRPKRLRRPTPQAVIARIGELRRQRLTGKAIAQKTGVSPATVSRVLKRLGLNRLSALDPPAPVRRYEREHPGELIHIDIEKLGRFKRIGHRITSDRTGQSSSRGVGWEFVHVCIDDASRIAFTGIMPDEKAVSAVAFLKAAVAKVTRTQPGRSVDRFRISGGSCATIGSSARRRTNRVFQSYDDILDHCCFAGNKRIGMPWKIMSIRSMDWAYRS